MQDDLSWKQALGNKSFRLKLFIGLIFIAAALGCLPFFFQYIQQRQGYILNDFVLRNLKPHDVSIPIFTIIWGMVILFVVRSIQSPLVFITYLYSFAILCLVRMVTIKCVALEPPTGLIDLVDPISNMFYGKSFITKDLFFSGHTATQWLFFLCFRRKIDKWLALFCTIAIGFLVLVQHVHYTIDVLAAPVFGTICFVISKKIVNSKPDDRKDQRANN